MKNNDKIDIVYLWVDGGDKKWATSRDRWYNKLHKTPTRDKNNLNACLYRDNGELKYSLRSVEECASWANHIYIITGFNQVPKWLNTKNKKITIVPHEQIMPKDALPTFNSNAIEMCIPNIQNLSEKFILMNDDTFFNKKVSPRFFFNRKNQAVVMYNNQKNINPDVKEWLKSADDYTRTLILSALKIKDIFGKDMLGIRPSHGIDPYIKSSIIECQNHKKIKSDIEQQIKNKFRTGNELQRWVLNLYGYVTGKTVLKKARGYKSGRHKISNFIYNTLHWRAVRNSPIFCFDAKESFESIKHAPVFCINDSKFTTKETIQNNLDFLQKRFPNKSQFEK
jgi:hypothetical protein